ncbi:MAG TPA: NgoFVII family restriction endonuclease [Thermosipho africanus]|nr:NgoFVII family restriction endonuclease [Thermosipho africanus]
MGLYHEKMGLMYDQFDNKVAFSGSMNETSAALHLNYEAIDVFCSWKDEATRVQMKEQAFLSIWNDQEANIKIINFPELNKEIIDKYKKQDIDFSKLVEEHIDIEYPGNDNFGQNIREPSFTINNKLGVPANIKLHSYQVEAIEQWKNYSYQGIFDMATGTGKSFTALFGIVELSKIIDNKLAVFIVCPFKHLVGQWEEDVIKWGVQPIIGHSESQQKDWETRLMNSYKRFRRSGKSFICITTNATFVSNKVQKIINNITKEMNVLLIVDEAHNFGATKLSHYLNESIRYRMALSATINRYLDRKGTKKIYDYFGEKCIEYPLEKAISEGKALVEYEYHPILTFLEDYELDKYQAYTQQLKKYSFVEEGKLKLTDKGKLILFQRARILAGAEQKPTLLMKLLTDYQYENFILVYCGATTSYDEETGEIEKQIISITRRIETELLMDVHKFTAEESADQRVMIKDCYSQGLYQVLTAIKCLDEGVNIPNIKTAFILSSSRNPKEFIQRRGRLLRKADGKDKAVIYDFVILPRSFNKIKYGDYENDKSIIIGEIARVFEFGRLALNRIDADNVIDEIQAAYNISIDIEEELERLEEEFDE